MAGILRAVAHLRDILQRHADTELALRKTSLTRSILSKGVFHASDLRGPAYTVSLDQLVLRSTLCPSVMPGPSRLLVEFNKAILSALCISALGSRLWSTGSN